MPIPILTEEEREDFFSNAPPGINKPQDEGELMKSKLKKKRIKKLKRILKD